MLFGQDNWLQVGRRSEECRFFYIRSIEKYLSRWSGEASKGTHLNINAPVLCLLLWELDRKNRDSFKCLDKEK